jgi:putative component of membrane protein insertase Oxa1/YidC/SpoIIIJ protein YidD
VKLVGFSLVSYYLLYISGRIIDECRFATRDSLREIHRVLRPGATFGMIWNIEDCMFCIPYLLSDEEANVTARQLSFGMGSQL